MQYDSSMMFSMQVSTVFCEHVKRSSDFLRRYFDLRYNAYTLLLCLLEANRPVRVEELSDYTMLSKYTVLSLLLNMEDRGLITKAESTQDGRIMVCELSAAGRELVQRASRDISNMLVQTFMASLPMEEFSRFGNIDSAVRALRGYDVAGFGATAPGTKAMPDREYLFPSGHFIEWRVVVDRWKARVRSKSEISFDEFRILEFVDAKGSVILKEVAENLQLQKSGVAVYKARLVQKDLLLERRDPFDGRSTIVRCTPEGASLVMRLRGELDTIMRAAHAGLSQTDEMVLNAWYMRMYSNMRLNTVPGE